MGFHIQSNLVQERHLITLTPRGDRKPIAVIRDAHIAQLRVPQVLRMLLARSVDLFRQLRCRTHDWPLTFVRHSIAIFFDQLIDFGAGQPLPENLGDGQPRRDEQLSDDLSEHVEGHVVRVFLLRRRRRRRRRRG